MHEWNGQSGWSSANLPATITSHILNRKYMRRCVLHCCIAILCILNLDVCRSKAQLHWLGVQGTRRVCVCVCTACKWKHLIFIPREWPKFSDAVERFIPFSLCRSTTGHPEYHHHYHHHSASAQSNQCTGCSIQIAAWQNLPQNGIVHDFGCLLLRLPPEDGSGNGATRPTEYFIFYVSFYRLKQCVNFA